MRDINKASIATDYAHNNKKLSPARGDYRIIPRTGNN